MKGRNCFMTEKEVGVVESRQETALALENHQSTELWQPRKILISKTGDGREPR